MQSCRKLCLGAVLLLTLSTTTYAQPQLPPPPQGTNNVVTNQPPPHIYTYTNDVPPRPFTNSCTGTLLFIAPDGGYNLGFPAIAPNGSFYFGAMASSPADGSAYWNLNGSDDFGNGAIDEDGTLYVGGRNDAFAINSWGGTNWIFHATNSVDYNNTTLYEGAPALGQDGTIYITSYDHLYAINPNGSMKWQFVYPFKDANGEPFSYQSPAVAADGTVFLATMEPRARLWAFNPNGSIKWSITDTNLNFVKTGTGCETPLAIGNTGTLYINIEGDSDAQSYAGETNRSWLYAISPTSGTILWTYTNWGAAPYTYGASDAAESGITVGPDETVYYTTFNGDGAAFYNNGSVMAVNNGKLKWQVPMIIDCSCRWSSQPALAADGTLYIGSFDGNAYALDSKDGSTLWSYPTGDQELGNHSPVIAPDGRVLFASGGAGMVFCGSAGPACSSWPMFGRNARHTRRVVNTHSQTLGYTNNTFSFKIAGQTNYVCDVCASMDMKYWQPVGSTQLTNGLNTATAAFSDAAGNGTNYPRRFYKVYAQ